MFPIDKTNYLNEGHWKFIQAQPFQDSFTLDDTQFLN